MNVFSRGRSHAAQNIIYVAGVFGVWLLFSIQHYVWLRFNHMPPNGDGVPYMLGGMEFLYSFPDCRFPLWLVKLLRYRFVLPYPPIGEFFYILYYKIFGLASEMDFMVNAFFFGIGAFGVAGVASELCNKKAGVFAALMFAMMPGVIFYSKMGMREFPLTCFFAAAYFFLLKSKSFTVAKYSIFFGVLSALSFTFKYEIIIFLVVPIVVTLWEAVCKVRSQQCSVSVITKNVCYAVCGFFVIASPWYILNYKTFLYVTLQRLTGQHDSVITFGLVDGFYYVRTLCAGIMTVVQAGTIAFCGLYFCVKKSIVKTVVCERVWMLSSLLCCIAFPLVVFTFVHPKDISHILPLVVFCIPLLTTLVFSCGHFLLRLFLLVSLFVNGVNAYGAQLNTFWRYTGWPTLVTMRLHLLDNYFYKNERHYNLFKPFGVYQGLCFDPWDSILRDMIQFIKQDSIERDADVGDVRNARLLVLTNLVPVRYHQLEYYNFKIGNVVVISSPLFTDYLGGTELRSDVAKVQERIFSEDYDYILMERPQVYTAEDARLETILRYLEENQTRFNEAYALVKKTALFRDNPSHAVLYKNMGTTKKVK